MQAFFFDMDNPAVKDDFDEDSEDDSDDDGELEDGEFEVEVRNGLSVRLDFIRTYDATEGKEIDDVAFETIVPGETVVFVAEEGDRVEVVKAGTDDLVTEIELKQSMALYTISEENVYTEQNIEGDMLEDEVFFDDDVDSFDVELHNGFNKMDLDIILVYDAFEDVEVRENQFRRVHPNETVIYEAAEGDRLQALIAGTKKVMYDIEIKRDQSQYNIEFDMSTFRREL